MAICIKQNIFWHHVTSKIRRTLNSANHNVRLQKLVIGNHSLIWNTFSFFYVTCPAFADYIMQHGYPFINRDHKLPLSLPTNMSRTAIYCWPFRFSSDAHWANLLLFFWQVACLICSIFVALILGTHVAVEPCQHDLVDPQVGSWGQLFSAPPNLLHLVDTFDWSWKSL